MKRVWPTPRVRGAVLAALIVATSVSAMGATAASAARNPLKNPAANQPMPTLADSTGDCSFGPAGGVTCKSPCYPNGQIKYNGSKACTKLLLAAINKAQASEHLRGFTLPSNYFRLSVASQVFVLVNLIRISLGIPPILGLSSALNAQAVSAASKAEDPVFKTSYGPVQVWYPPSGGRYAFGGAWAGDSVNAAAAIFGWFYDDGWGGKNNTWNFECTSPTSSGCWGHRDELLGEWAGTNCAQCVAGSGYVSPAARNWRESYDFLVVRPTHPVPLTFTWDRNVLPYLPAGWERVHAP